MCVYIAYHCVCSYMNIIIIRVYYTYTYYSYIKYLEIAHTYSPMKGSAI